MAYGQLNRRDDGRDGIACGEGDEEEKNDDNEERVQCRGGGKDAHAVNRLSSFVSWMGRNTSSPNTDRCGRQRQVDRGEIR